jgi:succinyl-CoA synthetase alpha subunit
MSDLPASAGGARTALRFDTFANLYRDSVTLMQLAAQLRQREGIVQASCVMGTPANLQQLADAGLMLDGAQPLPSDLLVVVSGDPEACAAALAAARETLLAAAGTGQGSGAAGFTPPRSSLALGVAERPDANLALVSVPGAYASAEAMKALALGLHVMLFSDNVPLADEVAIKRRARERGLLVMGPDCGTAIVNGVPLGFANAVRRGDIGLVAASGTGLQEVTCRIHNGGGGVSQALGTGGRDLHEAVGGITMLQGLAALADDAATRVIVLVSKPPAPAVARAVLDAAAAAAAAGKPVVVHFLGAPAQEIERRGLVAARSLAHTADCALALARARAGAPGAAPPRAVGADRSSAALIDPLTAAVADPRSAAGADASLAAPAHSAAAAFDEPPLDASLLDGLAPNQRTVRALFTGGTFCYEAQLAFLADGLACLSNAPAQGAGHFAGRLDVPLPAAKSGGPVPHLFVDLGDDDYTRGRPHPMIDPALRNEAIRAAGADAQVAAILFDVVLGYGAHADPARELADSLAAARATAQAAGRGLALIGHVCGTDADPQGRAAQIAAVERAGARIVGSNIEAAVLARRLVRELETRADRGGISGTPGRSA